jgi:methylated-DNA-[protein]-cysteine S-methyltransferase
MNDDSATTLEQTEVLMREQIAIIPSAPEVEATADRLAARIAREGLAEILYGSVDSPLGTLLLLSTRRGLVRLAFPEEGEGEVLEDLAGRLSPSIVQAPAALDGIRRELEEYFTGARHTFELALDWSLMTRFTKSVLRATAAIPFGETLSYAQIAAKAGSPRGYRAAGNALGSNPIPIVIPCHRVLSSAGTLGGYAGGPDRKRALLELEGSLPA